MISNNDKYYDFLAQGLAAMGYVDTHGNVNLSAWLNDFFKDKYNAEKTFTNMGFPLNPNIAVNPTYAQIEAKVRPYTMAARVDIDSDGPSKSLDSLAVKVGEIPVWKHEVYLDRKIQREKMQMAQIITQAGGNVPQEITDTMMELFFNSVDSLLGGNYNTMRFLRNQVVSNKCMVSIDTQNNPFGLPITIDFGVPTQNITESKWYSKSKSTSTVKQETKVTNGTINPLRVAKDIKVNAIRRDHAPVEMHWECSYETMLDMLELPVFRELYVIAHRPDITDAANRTAFGGTISDDVIWEYIQSCIGKIVVIDDLASVETIDTATHKPKVYDVESFKNGVLVLVPDGELGDTQFGRPFVIDTPGARNVFYDGGRTLLRTIFQDENMNYKVKSEFQGLPVPSKTRWMYYLDIGTFTD